MSDSVGASLPGAAPSEAAITAFLDAHRRVMDTDYESSDLPRVAVRAGLRAAYAVDRGAALEASPLLPTDPRAHRLTPEYLACTLRELAADNDAAATDIELHIAALEAELAGVRGEALPSDEKIAPHISGCASEIGRPCNCGSRGEEP